jgi:hypothetical protein
MIPVAWLGRLALLRLDDWRGEYDMNEQQATGQADFSVTHGLVDYPHRTITLLFWGAWLGFVLLIGSAALSASHDLTRGSPPPLLVLALLALFGGTVGLYQIYLALRRQPYLIINEEGIRRNAPLLNGDVIPWCEILALRLVTTRRRNHILYLVPQTPTPLLSRQTLGQWLFSMQPPYWFTGDIRLTALFPAIPPQDLVNQIVQRYSQELQTYRVAVDEY